MHPISFAQKENILSLASNGLSICQIASKTGVGRSTASRVLKNILPNQFVPSPGHLSKLSTHSQQSIITQISTGKASNSFQATKHINTIISNLVSSETVRRVLGKNSFKAVVKKKKSFLSEIHRKKQLNFAPKYKEWTVED